MKVQVQVMFLFDLLFFLLKFIICFVSPPSVSAFSFFHHTISWFCFIRTCYWFTYYIVQVMFYSYQAVNVTFYLEQTCHMTWNIQMRTLQSSLPTFFATFQPCGYMLAFLTKISLLENVNFNQNEKFRFWRKKGLEISFIYEIISQKKKNSWLLA